MAEETWHAARLIPTSGISGADEQERRATSALLAVMTAVRDFSHTIVRPLGAPAGHVETYIEVPFNLGDRRVFPDGLVRVARGQKQWTALVEVKTGPNKLGSEQIEAYLDVAREQGFDAVLTISNEISAMPGQHPTNIDKRKTKRVALHHLSWTQVLTEAVVQKEHRGISDPEQAWILGELIRYLEHPRSGALEFEDMGAWWVQIRDAVNAGTLRAGDKGASDVAGRFDALLRFAGLRLGRRLGTEVVLNLPRKQTNDPALRTSAVIQQLVENGKFTGSLRIPDTVGPLEIVADIRAGQMTCYVDVDAPREGRPRTRVNWITRQLKNAPDTVRIEAFVLHGRGAGSAELLKSVREDPDLLVTDKNKEFRSFRIAHTVKMGSKRGSGRGSFVDSVSVAIDEFYEQVMQNVRAWKATPPRFRDEEPDTATLSGAPAALISTALSSQDGPEPPAVSRSDESPNLSTLSSDEDAAS